MIEECRDAHAHPLVNTSNEAFFGYFRRCRLRTLDVSRRFATLRKHEVVYPARRRAICYRERRLPAAISGPHFGVDWHRAVTVHRAETHHHPGGGIEITKRRIPHDATLAAVDGTESAALSPQSFRQPFLELNSHCLWDEFDSNWYFDRNYKKLRDDDRQIVEFVRDFFATLDLSSHRHGIDVGAGTNLYPALTMLPFCDEITLYEYAASNVAWLRREIQSYSPSWDPWWSLLVKESAYRSFDSPREALAAAARVERGSIFNLPESRWDIGTIFFVAESISSALSEFRTALDSFVRSLRPGAPFAAAFMENSLGYDVGTHRFPAVAIDKDKVENCLADETEDLKIHRLGKTRNPLREGYDGMLLATGRVRAKLCQNGKDDR